MHPSPSARPNSQLEIPTHPQSPAQQQPYQDNEDPGALYGIIGIILAVLGLSLVGVIPSLIGHKKSRKAGIKNSVATISLWINVILTLVITVVVCISVATIYFAAKDAVEDNNSNYRNQTENMEPPTSEL